jgi:hypothetical protein
MLETASISGPSKGSLALPNSFFTVDWLRMICSVPSLLSESFGLSVASVYADYNFKWVFFRSFKAYVE